MSDSVMQDDGRHEAPGAAQAAPAPGALLRQARVHAGVHVDVLAASLKVPVCKLLALEEDRWDAFPDVVFVRALAASICRALKVDAAPILQSLPQGRPLHLTIDKGINAAFKDGQGPRRLAGASLGGFSSRPRWIPVIVAMLLLAAVALVFVPHRMGAWTGGDGAGNAPWSSPGAASPERAMQEPVPPQMPTPLAVPAPAPAVPSTASVASAAASTPEAAVAERQDLPASLTTASSLASPPEAAAALVIRARGETWVQVRNLSGEHAVQRVLQAGESLVAPGSPPWAVVIGKAAVTDVVVRGEPLDLSAIARENVARFEVK